MALFQTFNFSSPSKPEEMDSLLTTSFPGPDKPMIFKLLPQLNNQYYYPITYYRHKIGPEAKDVRLHPSLKSLGVVSSAPENEAFWEAIKTISALKKRGVKPDDTSNPEMVKAQARRRLFQPSEKGWFYYYEPNSPVIKAARFPVSVINALFGSPERGDKPAVPGLLEKYAQKGYSPYNFNSDKCWLKLYKRGDGLNTEYVVEVCESEEEQVINGQHATIKKILSYPIHPGIIKVIEEGLTDHFPDFLAFEKQFAFTLEESVEFVNSEGTVIPSRLLKRSDDAADELHAEEGATAASDGSASSANALSALDAIFGA